MDNVVGAWSVSGTNLPKTLAGAYAPAIKYAHVSALSGGGTNTGCVLSHTPKKSQPNIQYTQRNRLQTEHYGRL